LITTQEYLVSNGSRIDFYVGGTNYFRFNSFSFYGNNTRGATMHADSAPNYTNPGFAFQGAAGTGVGCGDVNSVSLVANSVEGMRITESGGGAIPSYDVTATITASTTQTQGATAPNFKD